MEVYVKNQIRLAGTVPESIVDGTGLRFALFAQGCPHHCEGCHNPHTHDYGGGRIYKIDGIIEMIFKNPLLDGVTFTGGEPFSQVEAFLELAEKINLKKSEYFNIYCFTGYTFEELFGMKNEKVNRLLSFIDVLIDGKFDESKKSLELKFKGSFNQREINSKESVRLGKAVSVI